MDKKVVTILIVAGLLTCCCVSIAGGIGALLYFDDSKDSTTTDFLSPIMDPTEVPENLVKNITTVIDTFDSNVNEWNVGEDDGEYSTSNQYISDGKMFFDITAKKAVIVSDTIPSQSIMDFDLSVDVAQISGPTDGDGAIIFRKLDQDNYYLFAVNEGYQEFSFTVRKDGEWVDIIDWKKSMFINQNGVNNLKVSAVGNTFNLYINNQLVGTMADSSISEGGAVGVAGEMYNAGDIGLFEFDNFTVTVK